VNFAGFLCNKFAWYWVRGGAVGWSNVIQAGRSRVRFPTVSLEFFIDIFLPDALWTQSLTEISTRNNSWGIKAAVAYG
jgi:hypothetical protein